MPPSNNLQTPIASDDVIRATVSDQHGSADDNLRSALLAALMPDSAPPNNGSIGSIGGSNVTASPTSTAPGNTHSHPEAETRPGLPKALWVVHPRVFTGKHASTVPRSAFFDHSKADHHAQGVFYTYCRQNFYDYVYYGPTELKRGGIIRYTARDAKTGERLMLVDVFAVNVLDVEDWWAMLDIPRAESADDEEDGCVMEGDDEDMDEEVEGVEDDGYDEEMEKEVEDDDDDESSSRPDVGDENTRGRVDEDEQNVYMVEDEGSQEEWMSDGEGSGMEETEDMKVFKTRY